MIYTWHICVVSGQTQTAFKTQLEIVNFASLTANSTLKYNKEKTASNNSRVNETGLCLCESHLMLLLKLRHVHADETLRKRATESCYSPFMRSRSFPIKVYLLTSLTFLMSLCMYRATCLASSVLPAQTAIKHLFASMQLISSNNVSVHVRVVLTHNYDVIPSGFLLPIEKREMCLFCWRVVASIISPSLYSSLRVM